MWQLRSPEPGTATHKVLAPAAIATEMLRSQCWCPSMQGSTVEVLSWDGRQLEVKGIPDGRELGRDLGSNSAQVSKRKALGMQNKAEGSRANPPADLSSSPRTALTGQGTLREVAQSPWSMRAFPSHPTHRNELDEVSRAEEGGWLGPGLCSLEDID